MIRQTGTNSEDNATQRLGVGWAGNRQGEPSALFEPGVPKYKERCPLCGKRVFDVSKDMIGSFGIHFKCPNCRNAISFHYGNISQ